MSAEGRFIDRMVRFTPELRPALDEHLADQDGELLPYVFGFETAKWFDATASSDAARAVAVLTWLEDEFVRAELPVRNLIDVGIIEMLPSVPEGAPQLDLLPPSLRERADVAGLFLTRES